MNPPREIGVVRVPTWRAAQRALDSLTCGGSPAAVRSRAVLVPTRQAAHELRRTLERLRLLDPTDAGAPTVLILPVIVTHAEWYGELHHRLGPGTPPLLSRVEREARLWTASDSAIAAGVAPPFSVRAGLIAEMLSLYDAVKRQNRSVEDFERVLVEALESSADFDRGAARLLVQTRHLVAVFREYERDLEAVGLDEHRLRSLLFERAPDPPFTHVVVTVPDVDADSDGLWRADFDLLLRLPGLTRVDVVATDRVLDAGFRERLSEWLPGLSETRWADTAPALGSPTLLMPSAGAARRSFTFRDREEELLAIAGRLAANGVAPLDEIVLVYSRPLPYVHLARRVFEAHGMPFTVADTLPLAAEPFPAALDLVLGVVRSEFARQAVVELLASPILSWCENGRPLPPRGLHVLARSWRESGYRGGLDGLLAAAHAGPAPRVDPRAAARLRRARAAARTLALDLQPFCAERPVTRHLQALRDLLAAREVRFPGSDERYVRGRTAIFALLDELIVAHERHGDRTMAFGEVAVLVGRAIEQHTFAPTVGAGGVRLLDTRAARYADVAVGCVLGVIEGDWPRPQRGSIFYPSSLLRYLGFPAERDRFPAARAAFRDLGDLPRQYVVVSTFQLEDDAIVRPSVLLEDMDDWPHPTKALADVGPEVPRASRLLARGTPAWCELRADRSDPAWQGFHGWAGAFRAESLPITRVEQYLDCPFKFFASTALGIEEEGEDSGVGLDPRRRGTLVHAAFERFFEAWAVAGQSAITAGSLPLAREAFEEVVTGLLEGVPAADRDIERSRLLGSPAAPGLGERVFRLEVARPSGVVERRLEHRLSGTYDFGEPDSPRLVSLRGKADRIDFLEDGTLRIIDYKTGRPPDRHRSIQLPIYALCAERQFVGYRGRRWTVSEAGFVAFRGGHDWVPVIEGVAGRQRLDEARRRFLQACDDIQRGVFPPSPAHRRLCRTCAFASVCRKDYVDQPS